MNAAPQRTFEDEDAVRGITPMLFGLIGPSGSGKTYSALRLGTGMQRVYGGDIWVVDTEKNRAKHYADHFKFRHINFEAPFSPLDYIDVIKHCEKKGAKTVIIDSMSHEHSGLGGCLEWHQAEVERLMNAWRTSEEKVNIPAWGKPKAARRQLINRITQSDINFILCFRAKDKIKIGDGKVVQLGWMPDAGEEFVFELVAKALLLPGAGGIPTLTSKQVGEQMMIKIPQQFRDIFNGTAGKPLDEDIGERLALWASGQDLTAAAYDGCQSEDALKVLEKRRKDMWPKLAPAIKTELKAAADRAAKRIAEAPKTVTTSSAGELPPDDNSWKETASAQESTADLDKSWAACKTAYRGDVPLEVEDAFKMVREQLVEKGEPEIVLTSDDM